MDGLLVDSEPIWHRAEIEVFSRHGVVLTPDLCRLTKGMFVGEVTRYWHARRPWTGPSPAEVADDIVDAVAVLLEEQSTLLPGVQHAIEFCRSRLAQLAVASSSPARLIDTVMRRFDLLRLFDVVHSAEFEPAGKPDPVVFLTTASLLGVEASRCVVFEDSPAGVEAALAAGMQCIAVPEHLAGAQTFVPPPSVPVLESLNSLDEKVWRAVESRVMDRPTVVGPH